MDNKASLLQALSHILPEHGLLSHAEACRPYECDGLSVYRQTPEIVVIPENMAQLKAILTLCYERNIPVVARGAGTGLSGGALPLKDGVLLSLAKFNRILNINPTNRTARVEPGVRNLAISEAVKPHGLFYAPDPSSQIACSIGGNVAENSGGVHCLKYGLTVHNVMGLRVLMMNGEELFLGGEALDSAGYDLLAIMNGSEGLLGIITEVIVKLLPLPESIQVLMASFDSVEAAGQAVGDIIASGIIPAGLEMMDNASIRASEAFAHAGYPTEAEALLLCEVDGTESDTHAQAIQIKTLLDNAGANDIQLASDTNERARLWAGRKAAFPAVGRISPDYYCMDGTIPRRFLPQVLKGIRQLSEAYDLPVANVFHAGDGNLHPLILYDANREGELHRTEEMGGKILQLCLDVGGTITGEHGVGMEKLDQMCLQFNDAERQQMHAVKAAFDEKGLLNPGKAVPSLHRCAELGAMHVHKGQLPFPELARF